MNRAEIEPQINSIHLIILKCVLLILRREEERGPDS